MTSKSLTKPSSSSSMNPVTTSYEFLGPPGALFITLAVPITTYALYFGCSEQAGGCPPSVPLGAIPDVIMHRLTNPVWWTSLWDTQATLMYFGWYAFCVAAWAVLPGAEVEGTVMRDGKKKAYKINAFSTFLLALGLTTGAIYRWGPSGFTFLYEKFVGFVTASVLMSVLQAAYVYAMSFRNGDHLLALGGNSGNFIYDFFIGRELNPSILSFDIKSFNELRPGLILWALIDISMACECAVRRGGSVYDISSGLMGGLSGLSKVTDSMWLVLLFQIGYVADGLYNEPAILTTMDITTDGFGFMLSVGDLAWVPFVYSLQARYLAFNSITLGPVLTALILCVNATGYWIFRGANGEKNDFRNGNNERGLKYMTTKSGRKLITSGWWGMSRHPNYFGDILMALAWSLPTGFSTPITYFYVIYFAVLLIHRQRRDDEACEKKYGEDWETYKKMVPWRIIPYVY